jgi:hypothetical protein
MLSAGLTFATPSSIPVQLGKWIALLEAFASRHEAHPHQPPREPCLASCKPVEIQLLEGGALRILFAFRHHDSFVAMKPWMEVDTERGVLASTPVPLFAVESGGARACENAVVDCAITIAEVVLAILDTFRAVGARDPGTLRDCFAYFFGTGRGRPGWRDDLGPLPNSRSLTKVQLASILHVSDQYRAKLGSSASWLALSHRYGDCGALERVRALAAQATAPAPTLLDARMRVRNAGGQEEAPPLPPLPPPPPLPPNACADSSAPECNNNNNAPIRALQRDECAQPVATARMSFTCASFEDVPVMVAKLMAVCTSSRIGHGQVRPHELQILGHQRHNAYMPIRVIMHVHRQVADEVALVPDWAQPYPAKGDRLARPILMAVPLPSWEENGVVAPLAHSVHLAALLHAWFDQANKAAKNRCRRFRELVGSKDDAQQPTLTEEQQHILLELSEEYLALLHNEWWKKPKNAPAKRIELPKGMAEADFPKLGESPTEDVTGRTTYMGSMFAITKPVQRQVDLQQLSSVAYLSPNHRDKMWLTGPRVPTWKPFDGTPRLVAC